MTRIEWSTESELFLIGLPGDEAHSILDAVEVMAASGRGFVREMLDGLGTFGLYLPRYVVFFVRGQDGRVRVLRARRR